jgi:hypothetical protein
MTITMVKPQLLKCGSPRGKRTGRKTGHDKYQQSFGLLVGRTRMHGKTLGRTGFVDNTLKEPANGSVRKRAFVVAFGVGEHFVFTSGLVDRDALLLLDAANFQGALRALIEQVDEFLVDFVHAAPPVSDVHTAASPIDRRAIPRFARDDNSRAVLSTRKFIAWPHGGRGRGARRL